MFAWQEEENLQQSIKRILGASLIWLIIGILTGLVLAFQRPLPWLFESWSWWTSTRLQLYHGGLLIFGFAIPMIQVCWMLRLRQLSDEATRWTTVWEWGYIIWQFGILWGVLGAFFGDHSSLPTWVWMPVIYGLFMISSAVTALGFALNTPRAAIGHRPLALQLLQIGAWALPLTLLLFLCMPHLRMAVAPSLLHTLIAISLLFPLIGLMIPLSLSLPKAPDYRRLRFFLWGGVACLPIASSTFSAALPVSWLTLLFQLGAASALLALLYTFASWWRYPQLFARHWLRAANRLKTPTPAMPTATFVDEGQPIDRTHVWLPFFRWGGICLAIAAAEMTLYSLLRKFGNMPSPTWSLSHLHILLVGTLMLWLQGVISMLVEPPPEQLARLRRQRIAAIAGVLLFALGSWWEGLLHFYLEQNGIPRGTIHSASGRWLRLLGGGCMGMSMWWMAQSTHWFKDHFQQLKRCPSPDDDKS